MKDGRVVLNHVLSAFTEQLLTNTMMVSENDLTVIKTFGHITHPYLLL